MALCLLAFAAAGCDRSPRSRTPANEIVAQLSAEPVTLDPSRAEDGHALRVLMNVMDGLVGYDEQGTLQLQLAESYRFSPDGRQVEFTLRPGTEWSDGKPVTADDFITSFRRAADPRTASRLGGTLMPIRNLQAILKGRMPPSRLGVRADGRKLVFELERPAPYFVEALTLPLAAPLRADVLKANGGEWPVTAPVTGAYRILERKIDRHILLVPNARYWNASAFKDRLPVRLLSIADEATGATLFENGKLDILVRVPTFDIPSLHRQGVLHSSPFMGTYYLGFNVTKPPFDRAEWRRAVSGAIRRREITEALQTGDAPAWGWVPRGLEGHIPYRDPAPRFAEDMKKVREAIAAAPKAVPAVLVSYDTSARNQLILEKVQKDVSEALGLKLRLESSDWKGYVRRMRDDPSQIHRFGWMAPYADPSSHMQVFLSDNSNNHSKFRNAEYDSLVRKALELRRGAERAKLLERAQKILIEEEAAVIPLFHYEQVFALIPRLRGFKANPSGVVLFRGIRKS
ncbi:MAG: peptide ABC transporter substrate-binding protein [Bdellovibrionales bacterium]|nr:peptide ABC transporter substrate-binding protein [Bdellovibrionales bacterium]